MIENPQPIWLPLLLLALPGIGLAAYALNRALFPPNDRPLCTIPAIGLVLALLPTHVLGLAFGSLNLGVAIAWGLTGAAGYAWVARNQRDFLFTAPSKDPGLARKLTITVLVTLPIVPPTILLNFYDEAYFNGHYAMIAHLQNNIYPPRYLYDPTLPLRYHYGFDLAGAIITGLLRVRLDQAIDLLTLALWPCTFLLLWRVGEHVGGRRAGLFVALAVCFSGGASQICSYKYSGTSMEGAKVLFCTVNGLQQNPPFISYFFQHPWGLGAPLFCLIVLQRAALSRIPNKALGLMALLCSLILLSLSQVVLFVTTLAALGLIEVRSMVWERNRDAVWMLLTLAMAAFGAKVIGGFFVSGDYPSAGGIFNSGFSLRDFTHSDAVVGQLQWNLASFGVLLVLGVVGLFRAKRDKVFLIILAALSLGIVNILSYRYSWDIVKFGTISFITMAIGAGVALADLTRWAAIWRRKLICAAVVILLTWAGVLYPFFMFFALYSREPRQPFSMQMLRPYFSHIYPVDDDDALAVNFLRKHMGAAEIMYRTVEKSEPYATWGGLPIQASMWPSAMGDNDANGLGGQKFAARLDLARISQDWFDRLAAQHISWLVADADDVDINAILARPEAKSRAVLAAQYGSIRIFKVH